MNKIKIVLLALLIIVIALLSLYFINTYKTKSLVNDILVDVNFDKVKASFVIDSKGDKILEFDKDDSIKLVQVLKKVELKRVLKVSKRVNYDYIVSVSGSGGSFQLYISEEGFVFFGNKVNEYYKFVDKKLLDDLLNIIKRQHHNLK